MKIAYEDSLRLNRANKQRLAEVNAIIEEYRADGYVLTLRQLYYQLVSRDIIPNKDSEYKKLGRILTKGRMAGVVHWDAIEDRGRVPYKPATWDSPEDIVRAVAKQYRKDRMADQDVHVEVWVEKDALSGVLKRITERYGVELMVNKGYSSTSAMHDSYLRFQDAVDDGKDVVVLYLGDHDPSGIDMVRDIRERTQIFFGVDPAEADLYSGDHERFSVERIALTKEQIDSFNPPPNPTKVTDPRADWYLDEYGHTSWEVDALKPQDLLDIVDRAIKRHVDLDQFEGVKEQEELEKGVLKLVHERWDEVSDFVQDGEL